MYVAYNNLTSIQTMDIKIYLEHQDLRLPTKHFYWRVKLEKWIIVFHLTTQIDKYSLFKMHVNVHVIWGLLTCKRWLNGRKYVTTSFWTVIKWKSSHNSRVGHNEEIVTRKFVILNVVRPNPTNLILQVQLGIYVILGISFFDSDAFWCIFISLKSSA